MAKERISTEDDALLAESLRINYRLRSTFFYRKLKEYSTLSLPSVVSKLLPVEHLYNWDERNRWGIGDDAFTYISSHPNIHLFEVFCHPKLLREHPQVLAYYRNIAALSQKSISNMLKISVKSIEDDRDNKVKLNSDIVFTLAKLFNEHITLIVDASIQSITKEELYGLLLASTGAQIDGSWRNAIGEEAEQVIQRLLINEAKERNLLAAFFLRKSTGTEPYDPTKLEEQLGNVHAYRGVLLTNRRSILFSSEPDISLLNEDGTIACVMEIKGGSDPAGALERYGAAKKSFGESRRLDPEVPTILVASCITREVHARIKQDPFITTYYNLTALLTEESSTYKEFMDMVFSLIGA